MMEGPGFTGVKRDRYTGVLRGRRVFPKNMFSLSAKGWENPLKPSKPVQAPRSSPPLSTTASKNPRPLQGVRSWRSALPCPVPRYPLRGPRNALSVLLPETPSFWLQALDLYSTLALKAAVAGHGRSANGALENIKEFGVLDVLGGRFFVI